MLRFDSMQGLCPYFMLYLHRADCHFPASARNRDALSLRMEREEHRGERRRQNLLPQHVEIRVSALRRRRPHSRRGAAAVVWGLPVRESVAGRLLARAQPTPAAAVRVRRRRHGVSQSSASSVLAAPARLGQVVLPERVGGGLDRALHPREREQRADAAEPFRLFAGELRSAPLDGDSGSSGHRELCVGAAAEPARWPRRPHARV
mmetsp:Transcript_32327/g.65908  ORF Transcript_32327/g.65908 Transcript_32327/m.65908 type:complete len:205 (+) Transcript_32327:345-959(+)